jgi:hypothetical protein
VHLNRSSRSASLPALSSSCQSPHHASPPVPQPCTMRPIARRVRHTDHHAPTLRPRRVVLEVPRVVTLDDSTAAPARGRERRSPPLPQSSPSGRVRPRPTHGAPGPLPVAPPCAPCAPHCPAPRGSRTREQQQPATPTPCHPGAAISTRTSTSAGRTPCPGRSTDDPSPHPFQRMSTYPLLDTSTSRPTSTRTGGLPFIRCHPVRLCPRCSGAVSPSRRATHVPPG